YRIAVGIAGGTYLNSSGARLVVAERGLAGSSGSPSGVSEWKEFAHPMLAQYIAQKNNPNPTDRYKVASIRACCGRIMARARSCGRVRKKRITLPAPWTARKVLWILTSAHCFLPRNITL